MCGRNFAVSLAKRDNTTFVGTDGNYGIVWMKYIDVLHRHTVHMREHRTSLAKQGVIGSTVGMNDFVYEIDQLDQCTSKTG